MIRAGIRRLSPPWASRAPRGAPERHAWPRPLVIALVAIACLAVIIPLARHKGSTAESSTQLTDQALATVAGVPQSGVYLGSASAPAQLTVFADMTSLRYGDFQQKVLPAVVERYVKPGKLRLRFATVAPASGDAGPSDGQEAALLAHAAGVQSRLWQFSGALAAQYVGVLDSATATEILRSVPGLDRRKALVDHQAPSVKAAVVRDTAAGQAAGASGGLAFALQVNGGAQQELPVAATSALQIAAIDRRVASLPARPGPAPAANATQSKTGQAALPGMRARVLTVRTIPATSAAGKANHRVRLVVRLQVRNTGDAPLFGGDNAAFVYLVLGNHEVNEDRHVWPRPISFKQNKAIAPGQTRTGVLRFELGGRDGQYIEQQKAGLIAIRPTDKPGAGGNVPVGVIRFSTD